MKEGFRQSMAWLHTWAGLIFGWLLFAIFLTGTLSYFKEEITHWTQPEVPVRPLDTAASLAVAQRYLQTHAADAGSWFIVPPDARKPALEVSWTPVGGGFRDRVSKLLDPATGEEVQARDSRGGEFFYRFHFQLQMPYPWGRWLATFCALVMFVGLITGIITHKKIFKEFFTFRPGKAQRSWLDAHNAIGVLALPFHLMISYSSLVIFMYMVMPASIIASYGGDAGKFFDDILRTPPAVEASGKPAPLQSLAGLYARVIEQDPAAPLAWVDIDHPGDQNARVHFVRNWNDRVARATGQGWLFDGAQGTALVTDTTPSTTVLIGSGFYGLHMGNFAGPLLRWVYFALGLISTAVIGTGLVMWLGKRQLKHAKSGTQPFELRLVEVLNIASMSGLVLAIASFFWANRLIPGLQEGRADLEISAFFSVWGFTLVHALLRPGRRAWAEQLALGALLWLTLPLLNGLTTGHGLNHSLADGDWIIGGLDLAALGAGLFLAWATHKIWRAPRPVAKRPAKAAPLIHSEAK